MKRFVTMLMAVVLLMGCIPIHICAAQTTPLGMPAIGEDGYKKMSTSQMMLDVLKVTEGFSANPYWDYAQWTIGFGSYAGSRDYNTKPNITVTPEEAEELLKQQLAASYEKYVNDYCKRIGKQPTQNQFDALVSFTYNLGSSWMSGSMLNSWLRNPTNELDLVNAMGRWVRAGGTMLYGLAQRRVREAIIFLKGEYYLPYKPSANHCVKSNLKVISNDDLPYYASVIYQYGFTYNGNSAGAGHEIAYYEIGKAYGSFDLPTRDGYQFKGWKITKRDDRRVEGSSLIDAVTVAKDNLELTAVWELITELPDNDPDSPDEPTAPTEPTVPTEPEPSKDPFRFEDVPVDAWFRTSVEFAYDADLMMGISDTAFDPYGSMTRGMLVAVLYRLDGSPEASEDSLHVFSDTNGQYYTEAVAWAKENGIVYGVTDDLFCPDWVVTRQDAVAIFQRYCVDYLGMDSVVEGDLSRFDDAGKISDYAVEPMRWAVGVGLVAGAQEGRQLLLSPKANLNRCQSAAMLTRLVTQIIP